MFSEQRRREEQALLAQDYALEQAEEKGLERGKVEGRETFCLLRHGSSRSPDFRGYQPAVGHVRC